MKCYVNAVVSHNDIDVNTLISPSLRRRMSTIVKVGVATGLQCVKIIENQSIDGIITATHLGCLEDSEKFLRNFIETDEQLVSPTPFIQSTFNTIGGQIALLCNINSYNITYTHRDKSFMWALKDALTLIAEGSKNILIVAYEEVTPTQIELLQRVQISTPVTDSVAAFGFIISAQPTSTTKGWIETTNFTAQELYNAFTQPID